MLLVEVIQHGVTQSQASTCERQSVVVSARVGHWLERNKGRWEWPESGLFDLPPQQYGVGVSTAVEVQAAWLPTRRWMMTAPAIIHCN